jgi:hypothetical protein
MSTASDTALAAQGSLGHGADVIAERRQLEARLYQEGLTLKQVGAIVGRSESVVMHDLAVLGIERRAARGRGRTPVHPPPTPRPCAYCGTIFTPRHSLAVGKFCSRLCGNRAKAEAQGHKRGEWRTCLQCGKEFWRYRSQLELPQVRGDFCTPKCWGSYRWLQSDGSSARPLVEANIERGHFGGRARQHWFGRWGGQKAGHLGGRPSALLSDEQQSEIKKLAAQGWGRRAIANRLLVSEWAVRNALSS